MLKLKSQLKKNHKHQMKELKDVTLIGSTEWKSEVGRSGQRDSHFVLLLLVKAFCLTFYTVWFFKRLKQKEIS